MPRFIETIPVFKRKKELISGYVLLVLGLTLVVLDIISRKLDWREFISIILAVNAIINCIRMIKGRKPFFFEWDNSKIQWLLHEKSTSIVAVSWDDLRWIKKEKSGGVTFYRESSFSQHFDMKWMRKEEQLLVMEQFLKIAQEKKIKTIDF